MNELLAECVANPDDDEPRLVWADAVGGERGELVVLQCDLARGGLSPATLRTRRLRERELLSKHAIEWAGEAATIANRWSFRRGFVETAIGYATLDVPKLRAAAPLLRSVTFTGIRNGALEPKRIAELEGLRGLGLTGDYIGDGFEAVAAELAKLGLTALALDGLDARYLPAVYAMLAALPIETLQLRNVRLQRRQFDRVLECLPRLKSLVLDPVEARSELLAVAGERPLQTLAITAVTGPELAALSITPCAQTLTKLGFMLGSPDLEPLAFPALKVLDVDGKMSVIAAALSPERLPALQVVQMHTALDSFLVAELNLRFGAPIVDEVRDDVHARKGPELVHHDASAALSLGAPRHRSSPVFALVRVHTRTVQVIPPLAVDEPVMLGRGISNTVSVADGSVARRHARLQWCGDHHEIVDLASSNGTTVGGDRVQRAVVRDNDSVTLGRVEYRYFIGDDAESRAAAFAGQR